MKKDRFLKSLAALCQRYGVGCAIISYRWGNDQVVATVTDRNDQHVCFAEQVARHLDQYHEATNPHKGHQN